MATICIVTACVGLTVAIIGAASPPDTPGQPLQGAPAGGPAEGASVAGRMQALPGSLVDPPGRSVVFRQGSVPRPAVILLLGLGFAGLGFMRANRRN